MRTSAETRKRVELWDTTCKSLCLRVEPSGRGTFYFRYRPRAGANAGRQRRHKLGAYGALTVHEARKAATRLRAQTDAGMDPSGERAATRAAPTVVEAAERYMAEHVRVHCKPRTVRTYRDLFDLHICPALGCRKVASIGRSDVERMHQDIAKSGDSGERKGGKGAANRALALFRALLNSAEVWGERPQNSNPCTGVRRFRERDPQQAARFLDAEERARLEFVLVTSENAAKGTPDYACAGAVAAIRLLSLTGARLSEITGLTWSMVDLPNLCLCLPDSKTGAKTIALSAQAARLLAELSARGEISDDALVVTGERGGKLENIQRSWRSIRARAGLADVRLHDLRHSFASDALNTGVPLALVGSMLCHRNVQTTARYAHVADDARRQAVEVAGNAIEAATRKGSAARAQPL